MTRWDESEHPRWPAKAPDSRGGEFRSATGWVGAVAATIRSPEQDLLDVVRGVEMDRTPLSGGQMARTEIVTFEAPDGTRRRVVHKQYGRSPAGTQGQRAGVAKEVLANRIGQVLGTRVPVTITDPDDESAMYMELLDGHTPFEIAGGGFETEDPDYADELLLEDFDQDRLDDLVQEHMRTPSGRRIGLLDLLLYHQDRHEGNWLILSDGTVAAIDNADVDLAGDDEDQDARMLAWGGGSPFIQDYMGMTSDLYPIGDLSPREAAQIRARLVALFDDPDVQRQLMLANNSPGLLAMYYDEPRIGAQGFIDGLLRRWDAIAAKAVGS